MRRKLLWSNNTSAKISTDTDDDSQQGPEHTENRPGADSSVVADRYDVADLELEAKEKVKESKEAPPNQARRKRGAKPVPN